MCVILVKTKDAALPGKEELKNCWERHSDGAGFAYRQPDGTVYYSKGYLAFKRLYKALLAVPPGLSLIVHFRTATHKVKDGGNTHPFPVADNIEQMRALEGLSDMLVFHNGVFHTPVDDLMSDTMIFVRDVVFPNKEVFLRENHMMMSMLLGGSKLAVMSKDHGIYLHGSWTKEDGLYWSNTYHRVQSHTYGGYTPGHAGYTQSYTRRTYDQTKACVRCKYDGPHLRVDTSSSEEQVAICKACWYTPDKHGFVPATAVVPPNTSSGYSRPEEETCSTCEHQTKATSEFPCSLCFRTTARPMWEAKKENA